KTADDVGGIARQAYQSGGVGALAVAFTADDANDFAQRVTSIDLALKWQGEKLSELATQRAETFAAQTRLIAVRRQVALVKAQSAAQVERAAQAALVAERAKSAVSAVAAQQKREVALLADRKSSERARLSDLSAEQERIEERLRKLAEAERAEARRRTESSGSSGSGSTGSGSTAGGSGALTMPVPGAPVTSEFGMRYHPIWHTYRLHSGMDLGIACGTPVRATAAGSVISSGWSDSYGNRIMVSHGQVRGVSLTSTYSHLTSITRSSGSVARGEVIGYSGTTGWSTGCHLHFEIYADGTPVNPRSWL
ncbi:MAG: peptidoglycan DD-metalloendopeptidase family protein, partial [Angustibacter sp.]